jgi:hypothetical protein
MGKPSPSHVGLPTPEHIGCVEGTPGSETSQYRQEEKTTCDSVSSGERKRIEPKPYACDTRQGLRVRGCGTAWIELTIDQAVTKCVASRTLWKVGP